MNYLQETIKYLSLCKDTKAETDREDNPGIFTNPTIRYLKISCVWWLVTPRSLYGPRRELYPAEGDSEHTQYALSLSTVQQLVQY